MLPPAQSASATTVWPTPECRWRNYSGGLAFPNRRFIDGRSSMWGLEVDQVRQPKNLQEENTRLKQLVADLTLDKAMLQDVLSRNLGPSRRRQVVEYLHAVTG
jgi:hypothetical protein